MIALILSSCSLRSNSNKEVVTVVTKKENLDKYVGKLITIKGELSFIECGRYHSKFSTIIEVAVICENFDTSMYGKNFIGTGILQTWVIKEDDPDRKKGCAGKYYVLKSPRNKYRNAKVKLFKE